jgi:membrane protease YdiL (CAAX protease family)
MNRESSNPSVRHELALFLSITAVLTALGVGIAIAEGVDLSDLDHASGLGQLALFSQAFAPGVAALVTRRVTTGSFRGLGLRLGRSRGYLRLSYAVPVGVVAVAYGILWATGAGEVDPGKLAADGPFEGGSEAGAPAAAALGLTLGVVPFLVLALGEEIGWRGLMSDRLSEVTTLPRTALWTGIAWTAFHLPLMLFVAGAVEGVPVAYGVAVFGLSLVALSYPLAWLRQRSRSIWPATLMHAAGNAALYLVADPLTREVAQTPWLGGETGALLPAVTVAAALGWWWFVARAESARSPLLAFHELSDLDPGRHVELAEDVS